MVALWDWIAGPAVTAEQAEQAFQGWEVIYHEEDGRPAAAALIKGTEVHLVVAPEWRRKLLRRDNVRAFAAALLERRDGMLTTRILHGSAGPNEFVRRLGFKPTWSDEQFHYYMLTSVPFERSSK